MTKKTKILSLLLAAAMLFGMAMAMPAMAAEMISVPNGDFEAETAAGTWSLTNAALATATDGTVYEGEKFMRLTGSGAHCISQKIAVDASAEYVLDFALRTGYMSCAYTVVNFYDAEGNAVAGTDGNTYKGNSSYVATAKAWAKRSDTFTTPANTASLIINLRTNVSAGEGDTVDYDAVRLIKKDANEKVTNGDMETGDVTGWTVSDGEKITADNTNPASGTYAMQLAGADSTIVTAEQKITGLVMTQNGGEYILTAQVNIPATLEGNGFRMSIYRNTTSLKNTFAAFGTDISGNNPTGYRTGKTDGYVTYSITLGNTVNISAGDHLTIMIELDGAGTVYVDNISLIPAGGKIYDGGFEDEYGHQYYIGGGWYAYGVKDYAVRTTEEKYSGKASLEIKYPGANVWNKYVYYYVDGLAEGAGVYRLDYMYKAVQNGTTILVTNNDLGKNYAYAVDHSDAGSMEYGKWMRGTVYLYKEEGKTKLPIRIRINPGSATDSIFIDDVSLSLDTSVLSFTKDTEMVGRETTTRNDATTARYHYVAKEATTEAKLPQMFVAAYKETVDGRVLAEIKLATGVEREVSIQNYPTADYPRNWYAYDYTCDLPAAPAGETYTYKAFVWNSLGGLTPIENAISTAS